jgi:hypothetical protein
VPPPWTSVPEPCLVAEATLAGPPVAAGGEAEGEEGRERGMDKVGMERD